MKNLLNKPFAYSYSNYCKYIIVINILVFFLTSISSEFIYYLAMNPLNVVRNHMWWQFVTYMFAHANFQHLFFNMLGLFFFGTYAEKGLGSKEFLLFFGVCGILAGLFSFFIYWTSGYYRIFLLGASGAVYAVLFAYAVLYPDSVIYLMGFIPLRAPVLVIGYTLIEIFSQLTGHSAGIAHLTHLGGFAFAYLYFMIRLKINPAERLFGRRY